MFYTFCDRVGSRIFHRYIDASGKRCQEIVSDFPFELFIRSPRNEACSLFGDKLGRMEFNQIQQALDFVKEYESVTEVYGQTSMAHQFISTSYKGLIDYDFNAFRILNFDIEVRTDGFEDDEECIVRRVHSNETETVTIGEMKALPSNWEVYDKVNERWYCVDDCPHRNPGGFPHAEQADYEITTISCKVFNKSKKVTFGLKEYQVKNKDQLYILCRDEKHLLIEFVTYIRAIDPDILTGWNIETFDIPYIVNRLKKICGEEWANKLSPFHASTKKCLQPYMAGEEKDEPAYRILGVNTLDYLQIYKKFNPKKQESYRLDYIAESELKERKLDYSEYDNDLMKLYQLNFEKYVDYNEHDVYLVERLDQKKQFIRLAITTVLMTKSRYQEVTGKVKMWDNLIYNMLRDDGIVIPPMPKRQHQDRIIGAWVKEPKAGKYRYVVSLDLTSLYPMICMMYNMSPETMIGEELGTLDYVARLLAGEDLAIDFKPDGCMAANGSAYRLDFEGVLPRAMRFVFDTRKRYKDEMKVVKKAKEKYIKGGGKDENVLADYENKIAMLDAAQGAMKILANSGYGVTAQASFRYFNRDIAQGITLTGQLTIQYIVKEVNRWLNERFGTNRDYVITADTDSMYLALDCVPTQHNDPAAAIEELDQFINNHLQPFIEESFVKLSDRMGCPKNLMDMKREALSDVGIWRAKKNYVLRVYDMEGVRYAEPEMKMMGIETAKSSTPKVIREELEKCLTIMLDDGKNEELLKELETFKKIYYTLPIEDVAKPMGVSDVNKYADPVHVFARGVTVPYNAKAALIHNHLIREKGLQKSVERIRNGNKIKLMALKKVNPVRNTYIAFANTLPEGFGLHSYVDYDAQYDITFMGPIRSFTDIIGWKTERVSTLEDLFG